MKSMAKGTMYISDGSYGVLDRQPDLVPYPVPYRSSYTKLSFDLAYELYKKDEENLYMVEYRWNDKYEEYDLRILRKEEIMAIRDYFNLQLEKHFGESIASALKLE